MANFLTCWLQDPGDLPVGDGPPGGSGDGNPNDDDDDDETCNGTLTWKFCNEPQNLDDVIADQAAGGSCDGEHSEALDCENPQADCRDDLGDKGCQACNNDTSLCNGCCDYKPVDCKGFICIGDGNNLTDDPCTKQDTQFTDVDAYKDCGGKNNTLGGGGCEWDGACKGYYMDNAACKADDPPACKGWTWEDTPPKKPGGDGGGPTTPPPGGEPPDCYMCGSPSWGSDGKCCFVSGKATWDGKISDWVCHPGSELDEDNCNLNCKESCMECDASVPGGSCGDVVKACGTCTYKGDEAAQKLACKSDPTNNCYDPDPTWDCTEGEVEAKCDLDGTPNENGFCDCTYRTHKCEPHTGDGDGLYDDPTCSSVDDSCECPSAEADKDCNLTTNCPGNSTNGGSSVWERIYGLNGGINPIYEKNVSNIKSKNPTTFVGVNRGNYRADLFKDIIHVGITATDDIIRKRINFSDRPFTDLSNANLEKSIHDDLILKLNLARAATGKNLKRMFLSTIRNLIVSNRLEYFDASQLHAI